MQYKTIDDLGNLNGKVVMLRADLNVPMDENFKVTNTARIDRTVPTIKELMSKGAKVVVISHFGRPEGKGDMKNSLSHIVKDLEKSLGHKVVFVDDCICDKVASEKAEPTPKKAMIHIQTMAPGPPYPMAVATPTMLPVPTRPESAMANA